MFSFSDDRLTKMTSQEMRWLDNVKKAIFASDQSIMERRSEECLEPLLRAVDTAKTLRRSLRGESIDERDNKKRFTGFIDLDVPTPAKEGLYVEVLDSRTGILKSYSFSQLAYAIRCAMIHENENLNAAEWDGYHISLDWSEPASRSFGAITGKKLTVNGYLIAKRIREVLAKFVTGIEGTRNFLEGRDFSISSAPALGSIRPLRKTV